MRTRRAAALATCTLAALSTAASAQTFRVTVDPGPTARRPAILTTTLKDYRPSVPHFLGTLTADDGKTIQVQADALLDDAGAPTGTLLHWLQPELQPNQPKTYKLAFSIQAYDGQPFFHFVEGDGYRDLLFGKQPVYRYMTKYDPADHANTFKPFHHVAGFHDEGFITKGPPGGLYPHHRGIFFGFKTQHGDFWHCPDVHQEHTGYRYEDEGTGPLAARAVSTVDWVGKDNRSVVRDTRDVTAERVSADELVLDYDLTVASLGGDVQLTGDPQHAGFHFRAAQEVADAKPPGAKVTAGGATYVRPPTAKLTKNDEWLDCPWVSCTFTIQGHPYTVLHMDHPSNPKPTTYCTRAYGRFGAFFIDTVKESTPMHLKYRVVVLDGAVHKDLSQDELSARYADFATPPKITITK
jgi:hypothetical protein